MARLDSPVREAALYLRILYRAEQAFAVGDEEQLVSLFSGVDPIDLMSLIAVMDTLSLVSGADPQAAPTALTSVAASTPISPDVHKESSAPVSIQNYSLRVPCE
jgi:hypothetical protein